MQVQFRQGIARYQTPLRGPIWLQKTSQGASSVDLNTDYEPVVITLAHYGANYLIEETRSIIGAWGGGAVGSTNGPLPASITSYLYWDIDLSTGALSRGWTIQAPYVSATEPSNPIDDLHWFDLSSTRMRVYKQTGQNPGYWIDKVRLFAGSFIQGTTVSPNPLGSQVGIIGTFSAGNLLLGANNVPLKQSDGTFATTVTELIVQQTSGQGVMFNATLVFAEAAQDIPAFYLISFLPNGQIGLASSNNFTEQVSGIVIKPLYSSEVGQVITNGVIRNEQWAFTPAQVNLPLFCGPTGELQLSPPITGVVQQVGLVYDLDAIYLNILSPVRLRGSASSGLKPIILETDGILGQVPDEGIISAGGVTGSTFTVAGKGVLLEGGVSSRPGGQPLTLQDVYNNSPMASGQTDIMLLNGKDLVINDPNNANFLSVSAATGQVTISGDLVVLGTSSTINISTLTYDHWLLAPASGITTALSIEPLAGVTPIVDLLSVRVTNGAAPAVRIDSSGNLILTQSLMMAGTINGIDLVTLNNQVQYHAVGDVGYRHQAADIDITSIAGLSATTVQTALEQLSSKQINSLVFGHSFIQAVNALSWVIIHNGGTLNVTATIYDASGAQVLPDEVILTDINTLTINFSTPMAGRAVLILF